MIFGRVLACRFYRYMVFSGGAWALFSLWPLADASAATLVRLVYAKGAGAEACPEPMQLRTAVMARLGYDPFSALASRTVIATIGRDGEQLKAKIELVNDDSNSQGVRQLEGPLDQCSSLIRAMALSISIAIDPDAMLSARQEPSTGEQRQGDQPLAVSGAVEHSPIMTAPAPSSAPKPRNTYFLGAGAHVSAGLAPAVEPGAHLLIGWQQRRYSWSFEGLYDPNRWSTEQGTEIGAEYLMLSAVPCVAEQSLSVCAVGSVGRVRAASHQIQHPSKDSAFYAAVAPRISLKLPLGSAFFWELHGDVVFPLVRLSIQIDDREHWSAPRLAGLLGTGIIWHYW